MFPLMFSCVHANAHVTLLKSDLKKKKRREQGRKERRKERRERERKKEKQLAEIKHLEKKQNVCHLRPNRIAEYSAAIDTN